MKRRGARLSVHCTSAVAPELCLRILRPVFGVSFFVSFARENCAGSACDHLRLLGGLEIPLILALNPFIY